MFKFILLSLTITLLTGCSLFAKEEPQERTVVEVKYVHPHVPNLLFSPCVPPKPQAIEVYMKFTQTEKENYLTDYLIATMGVVKTCNDKLALIKKTLDDEKKKKEGKPK